MSTTGNRSNPNETRIGGGLDGGPQNPNRSDITDRTQAGSKNPGGPSKKSSGSHQETRGQDKHNHPGQSGHKPQQHSPAEEKR